MILLVSIVLFWLLPADKVLGFIMDGRGILREH